MSKQIQDAYIVAATRTPIGRSHKGSFKHLRPDDLLGKHWSQLITPESLEAGEAATARLALAYRSLLPKQGVRFALNGGPEEALEGLHAKIFVIDRGWDASVLVGSANATNHARAHTVELNLEPSQTHSDFREAQTGPATQVVPAFLAALLP